MIYIPGNVPSSKNSKQIVSPRGGGRPMLIDSKTTAKYKKNYGIFYKSERSRFLKMIEGLEPPYYIAFKFIRDSRRRFDYVNPLQTVQDLMVKYEWIEDDNADFIIPVLRPYSYKKNDGGVEIHIVDKTLL